MEAAFTWLANPATWSGPTGIPARLLEHLGYSFAALVIAAAIAIPLGLYVGHTGRGRFLVVNAVGAARAIPSLGLLMLVVLWVSPLITSDLAYVIPSLIVLIVLAAPPILSGTYSGVDEVDPAARDAAKGMGMRGLQVLTQVELPCALPLIFSGLRSAMLQLVATATIAAIVSLGGLGRYLIDGLAQRDYGQMAGGALLVALLALGIDLVFGLIQRYAVSPGLTGRRVRTQAAADTAAAAAAV